MYKIWRFPDHPKGLWIEYPSVWLFRIEGKLYRAKDALEATITNERFRLTNRLISVITHVVIGENFAETLEFVLLNGEIA